MAVVIVHAERGVYLGNALGLGFWSKMDPAGQQAAITFATEEDALTHVSMWERGESVGVLFCNVVPDKGHYASVEACIAAGLDGWDVPSMAP